MEAVPSPETAMQCWECARRQLICDGSTSACNNCRASSIVCPGYGDSRPLVWLAPGKVKLRTWKKTRGQRPKKNLKNRVHNLVRVDDPKTIVNYALHLSEGLTSISQRLPWGTLFTAASGTGSEQADAVEAVQYCEFLSCVLVLFD